MKMLVITGIWLVIQLCYMSYKYGFIHGHEDARTTQGYVFNQTQRAFK